MLKPIYDLTGKCRQFVWGKEQQDSFEEIKGRLIKPPVLHISNTTGRFHLYSDTSKFVTGSVLCQIQNGKPKLIVYVHKRLPEAAKNYSIIEVELCGLAINIAIFSHLLKRVEFDAIVDHLALIHIIKSKAEPATIRIKRLLELISSYSFNLYYIKGKDIVLSHYLSRQKHANNNFLQYVPSTSQKYYNIGNTGNYLVHTQSQTKSSGIRHPEVHDIRKNLGPNILPEKTTCQSPKRQYRKAMHRSG